VLEKTLDMTNTHRLDEKTGQVSTIPPPSGRGEDSTGEADMIQKMHDIHSWAMQEVIENEKQRQREYEKFRQREQCRIYLERYNSPLAPYTRVMQDEAARVGSTIYMCPAVAMKESSVAHRCFAPKNAWGLMERPGGFGSWEEGIAFFYGFLWRYNISQGYAADGGYTTPNYCEPWPGSWAPEVDAHIREIQAIEVAPYNPNP
jgi:hypothetical protein